MKSLRKVVSAALLLICAYVFALPAMASAQMEHDGLDVKIVMDKEQYESGEPITATITVTNTNDHAVSVVNLEQLVPEGYVLAADSVAAKQNFEIPAGETVVLEVTLESQQTESAEEEETTNFLDKLLYGETLGIPNLLWAVILLIVFCVYMWLT